MNMARQFEKYDIGGLEAPGLFEVKGVDFIAFIGLTVEQNTLNQEMKVRLLA